MESPPMFNSVEDECRYWKERAKLYHKEWTDIKQEYDEYVEQSRQMEAEMDTTLEQKQAIIKDLRQKLTACEKENESLKVKIDSHNIEFANIEQQLETVRTDRDAVKEYLRQLEQKNDDLERAHRILNESIMNFEKMLDKAYEKNALLEMEVDEKEMLHERIQRLMDETRDLKQELNVKARPMPNGTVTSSSNASITAIGNGVICNGDTSTHELQQQQQPHATLTHNNINNSSSATTIKSIFSGKHLPDSDNLLNGNAMAPSSRTKALNIVADMLRKLNLDKALLCPSCQKFRCVCEDAVVAPSHANELSISSNSNSNPFNSSTNVANNSNINLSFTLNCSSSESSACLLSLSQHEKLPNSALNVSNRGTNIFKRFSDILNKTQNGTHSLPSTPVIKMSECNRNGNL